MTAISIERPTCDRCGGYVIRGRLCENCRGMTMIGDLCPKCDSVLSPDDEAAVADFGICRACLNKITETDWAAYQAALWEE